MIFWTTWMLAVIAGAVSIGAALDCRRLQGFWLTWGYFCMASGVLGSMLAVPL